ncbi:MAG TPA: arginine repressor [Allosphingosinicella sp.]
MTDGRARRQRSIADIIRGGGIVSQDEVTERLAALGYSVTQATVSRDLDQLGAVKVKRGGVTSYALPDQIGDSDWAAARLERLLREWVVSVEAAGNLLVLKTPPGSAHLVSLAVDQAKLPEVAGTVSGDDTLLLVVRDGVVADTLASRFREMSGKA